MAVELSRAAGCLASSMRKGGPCAHVARKTFTLLTGTRVCDAARRYALAPESTLGSAIELLSVLRNTTRNKAYYAVFWIGLVLFLAAAGGSPQGWFSLAAAILNALQQSAAEAKTRTPTSAESLLHSWSEEKPCI